MPTGSQRRWHIEMTHKAGKIDMGNFRWTAVFEKQDGKWMIVHEHVSEPLTGGDG